MLFRSESEWGGIDVLINNAGIYPARKFDDYSVELFEKVFQLNVLGVYTVTKAVVPIMEKMGKGAIINTSSMAGIDGAMANIGYTASKFAVEGLTVGSARELGLKGIRVNGVAPAGIDRVDFNGNAAANDSDEISLQMQEAVNIASHFAPLGSYPFFSFKIPGFAEPS